MLLSHTVFQQQSEFIAASQVEGIHTIEIVHGSGLPIKRGDWVKIHYEIVSGTRVVSSTKKVGLAFADHVGSARMPEFICQGLIGLKTHGSRTFIVPLHMLAESSKALPNDQSLQVKVWVLDHRPEKVKE